MKTSELIRTNALKYERFKDQLPQLWLTNPTEISQYRTDVNNAFDRISNQIANGGNNSIQIGIRIEYVSGQPYTSLKELTSDCEGGFMRVSTDFNDSALLPGDLNLKFRAVHDYLHFLFQQSFGFAGEMNVYKAQKFMHTTEIGRQILYSEIVLQASYCEYFGKFADTQKVILK